MVIHGAFAIDADLQIQGGDSMMNLAGDDDTADDHAMHESQAPALGEPTQANPERKSKRRPARERKPETPPAPAQNHQQHMQGHQH